MLSQVSKSVILLMQLVQWGSCSGMLYGEKFGSIVAMPPVRWINTNIGELNTLLKGSEASLAKINGSAFSLCDKSVRGWSSEIPIRQKEGHLRA